MFLFWLRMHFTTRRIFVVCRVLCENVAGATSSEGFVGFLTDNVSKTGDGMSRYLIYENSCRRPL